jgi:hypothetical protein
MTEERLKEIIGRILYVGSIGLMAVWCLCVAISFAFAIRHRMIPSVWWDAKGGNHGPWRYYEPVRTLFKCALASLLSGALMSAHTPALMKGNRPVLVLAIAIGVVVFHFVFLSWLTD